MLKLSLSFFLLLFVSANTFAEDSIAVTIVKEKCQFCHGLEGEASSVIYPRLAGQHKNYIIKQLQDFRSGQRQSTEMNDMAKDLTDEQITALADYFNSKPALSHKVRNKELAAVGQYIFHQGNEWSDIPACTNCHGEKGEGTDQLPRLAGQHKRYISSQLQGFSERKRTNDNAIMHSIASRLTEMEIQAVSLYVSGLK